MFEKAKRALKAGLNAMRQPGGIIYTGAAQTEAGVPVSDDSAMRFAAVHSCVRVISEDVAALPLRVYRRTEDGGKERWHGHPLYELLNDRPNGEMSSVSFKEALMVNALLTGNGYAFIEFDRAGRVKALWPMLSSEVTPYRNARGELRYRAGGEDLAAAEVFHLPGLGFDGLVGLSPIAYARESIGLGMAAERYGEKFFKNGTHIGGVISVDDELTDDQFERTKAQFSSMFRGLQNAHGVPVLEGGAKYTPIGIAPEDAQFLETRKFQRSEIAAIYRVPPHMIGDLERATFSNIEQQDLAYLQRTLLPWLMRIEKESLAKLVHPQERSLICIEHDTANFMRGETASRMQAYSTAIMAGIMTPNEARQRENLNPMEGGDTILLPLNMQPGAEPRPDTTQPKINTARSRRTFRNFEPGGERRAAGPKNIAAQLAWIGITRAELTRLENAFSIWLTRQADDIEKLMAEAGFADERSLPLPEQRRNGGHRKQTGTTAGDRNRLLRSINDYYEELSKRGAEELSEAIADGEFPGWRDINDAIEKIARSAWRHVAEDIGGETPDEEWIRGYMKRYREDMSARLCAANKAELERAIKRADGKTDTEIFGAISGNLAKWRLNETGKWRCGNMARNEAAMMRNEAMIAAYRQAGYASVWRAAPSCCRICTAMNGKTVATLKPPLHKGCVCSVGRGEKLPEKALQPWQEGGKLYSEDAVREWIRSDACNKRISVQQQARHSEGTKEYERYKKQFEDNGQSGPSYFDARHARYWTKDRLQRLVMEKAGTGEIEIRPGQSWSMTEEIILGKHDYIGYAVNNLSGQKQMTRRIKIHYSAKGVHLVPDYMKKDEE